MADTLQANQISWTPWASFINPILWTKGIFMSSLRSIPARVLCSSTAALALAACGGGDLIDDTSTEGTKVDQSSVSVMAPQGAASGAGDSPTREYVDRPYVLP